MEFFGPRQVPTHFDHDGALNEPLVGESDVRAISEWSARDFGIFYVRFRPQLINHVFKFIQNKDLAEEVVQDAFLYLMTSLPELESELDVLRYLKWKTKMLTFDHIRSANNSLNKGLVSLPEDVEGRNGELESIERADEAAIVGLALAKINPRQRQVLIATMYEEKTHEEVAVELGISKNAVRQLIHRARAAFKVALVGEASIEGKSLPSILLLASRHHRSTLTKVSTGTGLIAAFFVGVLALSSANVEVYPTLEAGSEISFESITRTPRTAGGEASKPTTPETDSSGDPGFIAPISSPETLAPNPATTGYSSDLIRETVGSVERDVATLDLSSEAARIEMASLLNLEFAEKWAASLTGVNRLSSQDPSVTVLSGDGVEAFILLDVASPEIIQQVSLVFSDENFEITAVPENSLVSLEQTSKGDVAVNYVATDFLFGDLSGAFQNLTLDSVEIRRSVLQIRINLTEIGEVADASIELLPRA